METAKKTQATKEEIKAWQEKKLLELKGWKKFKCNVLGWHAPINSFGFDGISFESYCYNCGRKILMDSQGNWFDY